MKARGYFLTILSAVIFGFTPVLAKVTYSMGSNGITMAFFRHLFVIPILFFIINFICNAINISFIHITCFIKSHKNSSIIYFSKI